jgi:ABC-type multidrug transport system fused ATPase/permease subunit
MRKSPLLFASFFIVINSFASFTVKEKVDTIAENSKELKEKLQGERIENISVKDFEKLTVKKMSFIQRLEFKIVKKRVENQLKEPGKLTSGFNVKGFLLGFFLPFYGVIIAYIFVKDSNFRKWAWIGLGSVLIVMLVVLFCVMLANFT